MGFVFGGVGSRGLLFEDDGIEGMFSTRNGRIRNCSIRIWMLGGIIVPRFFGADGPMISRIRMKMLYSDGVQVLLQTAPP